MKEFKKYIVWVDYGGEGWSPVETRDDFDTASNDVIAYLSNGNQNVIITEYIPVKLVPAKLEKIVQPVMRGS
jgi:hypothetical protein